MPYQLEIDQEMEEYELEVSVVDVYDIASEIGKEFEKIIDNHGTEAVTSLMPKVINALEHLEGLATRNERENTTVQELRARITQLEHDKIEKAEDRHRFEKELEQIEDHWREESRDLVAMVTRLQEENRKLSSSLAEHRDSSGDESSLALASEVDGVMLQRLRNVIDQQREQLRARDRELATKNEDIDSLTSQVERLTMLGKELRRKHRNAQSQVRGLIDERADFLAQLQDQQREVVMLRQRLGLAEKENEDLAKYQSETPDLSNKAVYDLDDPNRPRFTTAELKEILQERNELKARVSDLEDELDSYRPKTTESGPDTVFSPEIESEDKASETETPSPSIFPPLHPPSLIPIGEAIRLSTFSSPQKFFGRARRKNHFFPNGDEEDPPVQGPMPYEPDDAPWKKNESGIRKFFRKLFTESNGTFLGSSPKRSLSSLSKMALSSSSNAEIPV